MSQTSKVIKDIATGEVYTQLTTAIEQNDYKSMYEAYVQIDAQLEEGKGKIEEGIDNLPVRNIREHREKFLKSFEQATVRMLPLWHQIRRQLEKGMESNGVLEGEIFGAGKKGDSLVKAPDGAVVVLGGSKIEPGKRVKFTIMQEAGKVKFGRIFNLEPQNFYLTVTQETRDKTRAMLASIEDAVATFHERLQEDPWPELGKLLEDLEEIKSLTSSLQTEERRRIFNQISRHRRTLIHQSGTRFMFKYIAEREESEIEEFYQDGQEERDRALAALGLFRRYTYDSVKQEILSGEKPEGYIEIVSQMNEEVDSMDSAMRLLDFETAMEEVHPRAKGYLERMDRFFENLAQKARRVTETLAEKGITDHEEIRQAIETAFTPEVLLRELRYTFKGSRDFISSRKAFLELNRMLRNEEAVAAESTFRPYLNHKVQQAFNSHK